MTTVVWRSFKFFEMEAVRGPLERLEITSTCYGRSAIFFGDGDGNIYGFDRAGKALVVHFQAYGGPVTHMLHLRSRNVLVTVGDDDALNTSILRIWDLDKRPQQQQQPQQQQAPRGSAGQPQPRGGGFDVSSRPASREHRIFTPKYPPPPEAIQLRLTYNDDLAKKLKFLGRNASLAGSHNEAAKPAGGVPHESPRSSRTEAIPIKEFRTTVVSLDVTEDLQHAAIGLVNGEIVVIKGDLEHEKTLKMRRIRSSYARGRLTFSGYVPRTKTGTTAPRSQQSPSPQQNTVSASQGTAVAAASAWPFQRSTLAAVAAGVNASVGGLVGSSGSGISGAGGLAQILYSVHEDVITAWRVSPKGEYTEYRCEPAFGAAYECAGFSDDGQLVAASSTSNQVAFFGTSTLMGDLALGQFDPASLGAVQFAEIEGVKRRVFVHRSYVVVLTQNESHPDRFTLQSYDLDNRLRGFSRSQESYNNVAWVVADSTDVLVVAQEVKQDEVVVQKVTRLAEIDIQSKLEQLFNKECYDIAQKIARKLQGADSSQQMGIQKKYGDYLYSKGKHQEAIEQYIEAIGSLEPSYVIRLFLDGQRIVYLTHYLEELHHKRHGSLANKNHTTLLLNCYIKLRDEPKLQEFIHRDDIRFDAHNAIKVCRQAGYFDAATYLAEKYAKPDDYVKIQLENLNKPLSALTFIRALPVDDAEAILREHGKDLVRRTPIEATEVLTALATQWNGPARRLRDDTSTKAKGMQSQESAAGAQRRFARRSDAKDFIPVFVDSPVCLLRFLRAVVDSGVLEIEATPQDAEQQRVVYDTLLELCLTKQLKDSVRYTDPATITGAASTTSPNGHTDAAPGDVAPELASRKFQVDPYPRRLEQALVILETYAGRYDDYHALALVQQNDYEDGILFMLKRLKLYAEVFQHYANRFQHGISEPIRAAAKTKLIQACQQQRSQRERDGAPTEQEREMWISLLSMLVKSEDDVSQDITRVLEHVEKEDLLPPVAVVDILATNPRLQLRTVRDYVLRMIRKDTGKIEEHRAHVRETLQRTATLNRSIHDSLTSATVFQANKCAQCSSLLDLPAVHFLCRHSYHPRCLNDAFECNICGPSHRRLVVEQRQREEAAMDADAFFRQLRDKNDGFQVIAEYFGKGLFTAPALRKEALLFAGGPTFDGDGANEDEGGVFDDGFAKGLVDGGLENATYDETGELLRPEEVELW